MSLRIPDQVLGPFRERDTVIVVADVKDTNGVVIPGSMLDTMVYTLFSEKRPYSVINNRDHVDCSGAVDVSGHLTLELTSDDMAIVDGKLTEYHRLLFEWTYMTNRRGSYDVRVIVSNVARVP